MIHESSGVKVKFVLFAALPSLQGTTWHCDVKMETHLRRVNPQDTLDFNSNYLLSDELQAYSL